MNSNKLPIRRLPIGPIIPSIQKRHRYLTEEEMNLLFSTPIDVEEKIDGKTNIEITDDGGKLYWEDMKWKHSIHYKELPSYKIYLNYVKNGIVYPPETCKGKEDYFARPPILISDQKVNSYKELLHLLNLPSAYGASHLEGIVIKNYEKQIFGKIVRVEFTQGIDKHWMKKPKVFNWIKRQKAV